MIWTPTKIGFVAVSEPYVCFVDGEGASWVAEIGLREDGVDRPPSMRTQPCKSAEEGQAWCASVLGITNEKGATS